MKRKIGLVVGGLALVLGLAALAEATKKSPAAETSITLGDKQLKIDYSAPSARGRKVFGGLVPHGEVWRTGANAATTLTTGADLQLGTLKVPKGKYTLFTLPTEGGMTLIVNKQTGQWGTKYDEAQDLGRVPMEVKKSDAMVETLEIKLASAGGAKGTLVMAWERMVATVGFTAE